MVGDGGLETAQCSEWDLVTKEGQEHSLPLSPGSQAELSMQRRERKLIYPPVGLLAIAQRPRANRPQKMLRSPVRMRLEDPGFQEAAPLHRSDWQQDTLAFCFI